MFSRIQDGGDATPCGAPAFDRLSPERQAFAVLAVVQRLTGDLPPPLLPEAWTDGAVFALFELVHREIASEIEGAGRAGGMPNPIWRRLVRDAFVEAWGDGPGGIPAVNSGDRREWDLCVLSLADRILQSHEFLYEDRHDPSGTPPHYFIAEPSEWTPAEKRDLLDFLGEIVHEFDRRAA